MIRAFARMTKGVLAVLGEDSFLRGETIPYKVNVEHGVDVEGFNDNVIVQRSIATIPVEANPKTGEMLAHPDGTYRLEVLHEDNGHSRSFILLKL
jgi:hypothetical protein